MLLTPFLTSALWRHDDFVQASVRAVGDLAGSGALLADVDPRHISSTLPALPVADAVEMPWAKLLPDAEVAESPALWFDCPAAHDSEDPADLEGPDSDEDGSDGM